ncbi:MAG: hypothetical protein WCJ11_12630 [Methylococcaceae bacterium]
MNQIMVLADDAISALEELKELERTGKIFAMTDLTTFAFSYEKNGDFDANKFINDFNDFEGSD